MRRHAGFTLIEVLVVLAIISAILGGVSLMIAQAGRTRMKMEAKTRVTNLGAAVEQLYSPDKLRMYPPSRMDALAGPGAAGAGVGKKVGMPNDTNCGIETVYVALRLKGIALGSVPGFEGSGGLGNTDDDQGAEMVPDLMSPKLFEYLDPWNNPLVYISARDYKDPKGVETYVLGDGRTVKVQPKTAENGEYVRSTSFQLFSLGPDGQPGTEDDIHYGDQ